MGKIFEVSGYWKDNLSEFDGLLISEYDDTPEGYEDDEIFWYGLSEQDLIETKSEDSTLEFVITSYKIL